MTTETTTHEFAPEASTTPHLRTLEPRMQSPALLVPGAVKHLGALGQIVHGQGVPATTLELVHLRTSQINGCAWCIDYGMRQARKAGESEDRLASVSAWRESPYLSEAECAAIELAESVTRLADSSDPVPDAIWNRATEHYDEQALAALVLYIGVTNVYNRLNVTTRQVAGVVG
ncbi:carboxymuconolactone decarboxylase family protein [Promicromonospora iranensis]|uniref:AhpD family alkylhydroperoxidase n=1 Tax=Promicromonospora iranensis TaxID=1105144 RepID=A0ABU2CMP8_9MICO|nr:carboxymuconolactone decarboxylase family protein [Promicromonospora iranensis]MDR7382614.1 AhpD family alkylhydroperoxidase [Promicromonospora iranensis]